MLILFTRAFFLFIFLFRFVDGKALSFWENRKIASKLFSVTKLILLLFFIVISRFLKYDLYVLYCERELERERYSKLRFAACNLYYISIIQYFYQHQTRNVHICYQFNLRMELRK